MIRIIAITIFLFTSSASFGDCKYSATADVENNTLVNKKEKYVCTEDKSFLYAFFTEDEWAKTATMTILFIMENL